MADDRVIARMAADGKELGRWATAAVANENPDVVLTEMTGIEIGRVGEEWPSMNGPFTLTAEHIQSVIASQSDPAIKSPRVKLGHNSSFTPDSPYDPFSGQPVFGKFVNLRTDDSGTQLLGDIAGIPKWAAEVLPYAWPSRSGEWLSDWNNNGTAKTTYPMVLSAVALLGVELPGITHIEDLPALFTAEGPEGVKVIVDGAKVRSSARKGEMPEATTRSRKAGNVIITSVDSADVRRSFFEDFAPIGGDRQWWWPTDVFINPQAVIAVDEDTDDLYYCEYEVKGDEVSWKDPVEVKHQFVAADGGKVLASVVTTPVASFKTAADVRPQDRTRNTTKEDSVAKPAKTAVLEPAQLRELTGLDEEALPDDATDQQIQDALRTHYSNPEPPTKMDPSTEGSPNVQEGGTEETNEADDTGDDDKTVTVSREVWNESQRRLEKLETESATRTEGETRQRRDGIVKSAIDSGRIAPAEREFYRDLLDVDEAKTEAKLNKLQPNKVPIRERGKDVTDTTRQTQGTGLLPELRKKEANA